ncbi:MAG: hypothetical protein ACKPJ9_10830 [Dolichospermum sp.]
MTSKMSKELQIEEEFIFQPNHYKELQIDMDQLLKGVNFSNKTCMSLTLWWGIFIFLDLHELIFYRNELQ